MVVWFILDGSVSANHEVLAGYPGLPGPKSLREICVLFIIPADNVPKPFVMEIDVPYGGQKCLSRYHISSIHTTVPINPCERYQSLVFEGKGTLLSAIGLRSRLNKARRLPGKRSVHPLAA